MGAVLSDETKEKIAKAHRGKKLSPEHRAKVIKTLNHGIGKNNPNWKGGIVSSEDGYLLVKVSEHPRSRKCGDYVGVHVLVLEEKLGRYLKSNEVAHHKNEIKTDNSIENLELMTFSEHSRYHRHEYWNNKKETIKEEKL